MLDENGNPVEEAPQPLPQDDSPAPPIPPQPAVAPESEPELKKPVAVPVLQSVEHAHAELEAHPNRISTLSDKGHVTR